MKPKRPQRIPVWLEKEEQQRLEAAVRRADDIPENIFGQRREHLRTIRQRYEMLFGLRLDSGLRISEALGLKVRDVRPRDGAALERLSDRVLGGAPPGSRPNRPPAGVSAQTGDLSVKNDTYFV